MIVCDREFDQRDPKDPRHSLIEVDIYGGTPARSGMPSHRLSLRKTFFSPGFGPPMFELYRHFHETGEDQVVCRTLSLAEILARAHREFEAYHGATEPDRVCTHRPPCRAITCPVSAGEALGVASPVTGMEVSTHTTNRQEE